MIECIEDIPSSPFYLSEKYKNNETPSDYLHRIYKIELNDVLKSFTANWNYTLIFKAPILTISNHTLPLKLPAATLVISSNDIVDATKQKLIVSNDVDIIVKLRKPNESLYGPIFSATIITTVIWLLYWIAQNRFARNVKLHFAAQETEALALKEDMKQVINSTAPNEKKCY